MFEIIKKVVAGIWFCKFELMWDCLRLLVWSPVAIAAGLLCLIATAHVAMMVELLISIPIACITGWLFYMLLKDIKEIEEDIRDSITYYFW